MSQKFRITQNFVKNEPKTAENVIARNILWKGASLNILHYFSTVGPKKKKKKLGSVTLCLSFFVKENKLLM